MPIVPIEEAPRAGVESYLTANTNFFRKHGVAAVAWRYYDEAFNRGKRRGLVYLQGDRVRGFIGVIPAQRARGTVLEPLNWTCDWGLEDQKATPGVGVLLLKKVISSVPNAMTIGGNANTRTLVPRLAAQTFPDVGLGFWRPLRADAVFHLGSMRLPWLRHLTATPLGRLPVPWPLRTRRLTTRVVDGIAPALDGMFEAMKPAEWTARYDVAFLQWALERCPGLDCATIVVDGPRAPVAGAVLWHSQHPAIRHLRFAIWAMPDAGDAAHAVIREVVRVARARAASIVSTVVGAWDPEQIALLRATGFFPRPSKLPVFALSRGIDALRGINYFAADAAQRFSTENR